MYRLCGVLSMGLLLLAACGLPMGTPTAVPSPTFVPSATPTGTFTATLTATPSPTATLTTTPTPTSTPTVTPTATPTPDPYAGLTIADLSARSYGGGALKIEEFWGFSGVFTRTLISYPSDGLTIYGFMDVPRGPGPFPVAIVLHGYIDPAKYDTIAYTTRYADALANAGYIAIHPNLRGYPPSDSGPNRFRVGMAVDVLNLIAIVQEQAGRPGPLVQADGTAIGLVGHSMGGGIAIRVITVNPGVRAAVLYGSMSADEKVNLERMVHWSGGQRRPEELETPEEDLRRISPVYFLDRIAAAVSIHHGERDATVPPEWSRDLAERLKALNKTVEYFTYPGAVHTFSGAPDQLFIQRMITFFDRYVKRKG